MLTNFFKFEFESVAQGLCGGMHEGFCLTLGVFADSHIENIKKLPHSYSMLLSWGPSDSTQKLA